MFFWNCNYPSSLDTPDYVRVGEEEENQWKILQNMKIRDEWKNIKKKNGKNFINIVTLLFLLFYCLKFIQNILKFMY